MSPHALQHLHKIYPRWRVIPPQTSQKYSRCNFIRWRGSLSCWLLAYTSTGVGPAAQLVCATQLNVGIRIHPWALDNVFESSCWIIGQFFKPKTTQFWAMCSPQLDHCWCNGQLKRMWSSEYANRAMIDIRLASQAKHLSNLERYPCSDFFFKSKFNIFGMFWSVTLFKPMYR